MLIYKKLLHEKLDNQINQGPQLQFFFDFDTHHNQLPAVTLWSYRVVMDWTMLLFLEMEA